MNKSIDNDMNNFSDDNSSSSSSAPPPPKILTASAIHTAPNDMSVAVKIEPRLLPIKLARNPTMTIPTMTPTTTLYVIDSTIQVGHDELLL
mmetsp:Transcript_30529/g.74140  ORF Transcript_30529/g.74140 Transcript_30529/m.74140 type:complete len:91 (+) Transcript_30529:252-524(+)